MNREHDNQDPLDASISEHKPRSGNDTAAIKELFGLLLDAQDPENRDDQARAINNAPPDVRLAAQGLLEAHKRAAGILLDDQSHQPGPSDPSDPPHPSKPGPASDAPPAPIAPRIEHYEIGPEIGRGGFGIVYEARQLRPVRRLVAIKLLRAELATPETIARFRAESDVLARMNHESIARVFDAGIDHLGRPFVAMELIDGEPLIQACDRLALDLRQRVELLIRVCDAVQHAHQRAVIHRDLKPANVLVVQTQHGPRPRVIDFGIAKLLSENTDENPGPPHTTREHVRLGTPRYMSPQQRSTGAPADTRIDVYALGAMLCEALTGDVPHPLGADPDPSSPSGSSGSSGSSWRRASRPSRIAARAAPSIAQTSRLLKGDLDRIILKATAADMTIRYSSAAALGDDLTRYLQGRTVNAAPPGVLYSARRFVRRHRVPVSLAAAAMLLLIGALSFAIIGWRQANLQRDRARASSDRVAFIGDFLLDTLLLTADSSTRQTPPAITDGTLQKIADRAIGSLDEDPKNMVTLLKAIGRIQAQFDLAPAGARTLRAAIDFAARDPSLADQLVDLRVDLYDLLWGHGLDGAQEQITLALREARTLYDEPDPRRLRVEQRTAATTEELERIVGYYRDHPRGVSPSDSYTALFALSMRHRFGPTPEKQVPYSKWLYEMSREQLGALNPRTLEAQSYYGEVLSTYEPADEVATLLEDALQSALRVLGEPHFTTGTIRRSLAGLYGRLGKPALGIPLALDDVRLTAVAYGDTSIQHANALQVLGILYTISGDTAPAIENLSRALDLNATHWSPGSNHITTLQVQLARALIDAGDDDRAQELLISALGAMRPRTMASSIVSAAQMRAGILRRQGDGTVALALVGETIERLEREGIAESVIAPLRSD